MPERDSLGSASSEQFIRTGRMSYYAPLLHYIQTHLFNQMRYCMECSASFERSYTLVVFAFEEEVESRSWLVVPRARSDFIDRLVRQEGSSVYVLSYLFERLRNGRSLERQGTSDVCHDRDVDDSAK